MSKQRLTIKHFAEAYKVMKARGWTATADQYCNKPDKQVCPIAALALASRINMPPDVESYDFRQRVVSHYRVSLPYVEGIIGGVDDPELPLEDGHSTDYKAGFALGRKL